MGLRALLIALCWLSVPSGAIADATTPLGPSPEAAKASFRATESSSATVTARYAPSLPERRKLRLRSDTVLIVDQLDGKVLYAKNTRKTKPIASITKLMTAMVVLDSDLPPGEEIRIRSQDKDRLRWSRSYLPIGSSLTRRELLQLALMASENRAAAALARSYPGGTEAFVQSMNTKAKSLGMRNTTFVDATGLHSENQSTAEDLAIMLRKAWQYPEIRRITTTPSFTIETRGKAHERTFNNTNPLIRKRRKHWVIGLSKTGYILEAGRCLVMQAEVAGRPLFIVLLDAWGKYTSIGDANRIRKWLLSKNPSQAEVG